MNKIFRFLALSGLVFFQTTLLAKPLYKDASAAIEARVEDLLSRMTLHEKVMQLNQYVHGTNMNLHNIGKIDDHYPLEAGSYIYYSQDPEMRNELQKKIIKETRLGIPAIFAHDVTHGFRTIYPMPIAQAASGNPVLVEQTCAMAAKESRLSGTDWTFSPMLDVARDPRWGRITETFGEDPHMNSIFGVATVKGYQGDDISSTERIAACLKHFVGYGATQGGRDYRQADISDNDLWNIHLKPFKACVDAGAATLMSAFNDINGIPCTSNQNILTDILRNRWNFSGATISDWASVSQLKDYQATVATYSEAAIRSLLAGIDIDMCSGCYSSTLDSLANINAVPIDRINEAVRSVLRLKFRLGIFDRPFTTETKREKRLLTPENIAIAERLAEESMVLLKNNNNALPLTQHKIAVIGPAATDRRIMYGEWFSHGDVNDAQTLLEGITHEFESQTEISFAKGCDFDGNDRSGFPEAIETARNADIVILCMGERGNWSCENNSRAEISIPQIQRDLIKELSATKKPLVLVLTNGRPVVLTEIEPMLDAIIEIWQPGIRGGNALAGILSGRVNPSGKLPVTFPRSAAQIPLYYSSRRGARFSPHGDYKDIPSNPLYEFGHGLGYSCFEYGNIKSDKIHLNKDDELTLSIDVRNSGDKDGKEIVHWFVTDPISSVVRPFKELKHFEKKEIKAGEKQTFTFKINPIRDLSFMDNNGNLILESGDFIISVKDKKLKINLE